MTFLQKSFFYFAWFIPTTLSAQTTADAFFDTADELFQQYVQEGQIDYGSIKADARLDQLVKTIGTFALEGTTPKVQKAFLINAYNILVIHGVAQSYPVQSVQQISGFFDRNKYTVAGENLTLNQLEKDRLLKTTKDARLHFVLVCGAKGCPPIIPVVYRPATLEQQLDQQTQLAMNNPDFIQIRANEKIGLSKIFQWYNDDFGGNRKSIFNFINQYRNNAIAENAKADFYDYDWTLNDIVVLGTANGGTNATRYVTSATIPKGQWEVKIFNNLYSEKYPAGGGAGSRSTFFTTSTSLLYGVGPRFNAGIDIRYRRVLNDNLPNSALAVFKNLEQGSGRQGITGIGPRIRWAPVPKWSGFSLQSTLTFPIGNNLAGTNEKPYIDWNGATFWNQFFYDKSIGTNFSVFFEGDLIVEDIGNSFRTSTPLTFIGSYFPNKKTTLYGLTGFAPIFQAPFDYYYQLGLGSKYQVTRRFEVELLYTLFRNRFQVENSGKANTFNLGVRFTL